METTKDERDELEDRLLGYAGDTLVTENHDFRVDQAYRLLSDADRLAQYESRCIPRTADMPEDAVTFHKDEAGECWLSDQHPIGPLLTGWDDLAPGESGPLSRYIVDVE